MGHLSVRLHTVKAQEQKAGWTIYWKPDEVQAGEVTVEKADGTVVPLDGYLDNNFQEVYLDGGDAEMVKKLTSFASESVLDEYVETIEGEVRKYLTDHVNCGKAAKRMYNVFRITGRHDDAAFIRELFDEPATILYQVWSLIMTLKNATEPGSATPMDTVRAQADALIIQVVDVLDGDEEVEIVKALLALRSSLDGQHSGEAKTAAVEGAQTKVVNLINTFFRDRLMGVPTIREYIDEIQANAGEPAH